MLESILNKNSAAWLVVRVLGLVSLGLACYQLYGFTINLIAVVPNLQQTLPSNGTLRLVNLRWEPFFCFVFLSLLAVYLLRYGLIIHKLLMRESGTR